MQRLGKSDRHTQIVAELRAAPSLRINDLAARLAVSTETIRRDLAELDSAGLISRTYGGATAAVRHEPSIAVREMQMVSERQKIAAAAVQLVDPKDILMIGGGATTLHFARRLAVDFDYLTVITQAFSIAVALSANSTHKILMLPGQYDGQEGLIDGAETVDALQLFHANKAFIGASGLTEQGPNDTSPGPGLIYRTMMRRSARAIILADHSKFNVPSLTVYGAWSPHLTLISDKRPEGPLAEGIKAAGAHVIEAVDKQHP
jgi:DeoR/GlpR family transcriptional regulator of sugar metabolism